MTIDQEKLVTTWIDFQRTKNPDLEWSNDDFIDLVNEQPEDGWECIVRVIDKEASDAIVACLAEGPVEDLLAEHGAQFFDRIDELSRQNLVFARVLKKVWVEGMPTEVKSRISAMQKKYGSGV